MARKNSRDDLTRRTNVSEFTGFTERKKNNNRKEDNSGVMRRSNVSGFVDFVSKKQDRKRNGEDEKRENRRTVETDSGRKIQHHQTKSEMKSWTGNNSVIDESGRKNRMHESEDETRKTNTSEFENWHKEQQGTMSYHTGRGSRYHGSEAAKRNEYMQKTEEEAARARARQNSYESMKRDKVSQLLGAVDRKRKEQEQQAAAAQQGRFEGQLNSMSGNLLGAVDKKQKEQAAQEAAAAAKAQENRYAGMKQSRVDQLLGGIGIANRKKAEAAQAEAQAQAARTDRGYGSAMGSRADQLLGMVAQKRKEKEEILRSAQNDEAQQKKVAQARRYANFKQNKVDQLLDMVAQKKQAIDYKRRTAGSNSNNREENAGTKYISFYDGDLNKNVVIPTTVNGKTVSDDEAIDYYFQSGNHLGMFNSREEADRYVEDLNSGKANTRQADVGRFADYAKKDVGIGQKKDSSAALGMTPEGTRNGTKAQNSTQYSVPMADKKTMLQRAEEQQQKVIDAYNRKEAAAFFEKENPDLAYMYDENTRNIGIQYWTEELQKAQDAKTNRINEYNEANFAFASEFKNNPLRQIGYVVNDIYEQAVENAHVTREDQARWEEEISRITAEMTGEDKALGEELLDMLDEGDYEGIRDRYYEVENALRPVDQSGEYDERINQAKYWLNQLEHAEENGKTALMYGNYTEYTAEELDEAEKLLQEKYKEIEAGKPEKGSLEELGVMLAPMDPVTGKTLSGYNYTTDAMQDIQSRLKQITKAREQLKEVQKYEGIKVDNPDYTYHPEDISWGNISNKLAAEFTGILDGANAQEVYVYLNEGTREYPMTNTIALITGRDPIDAHKTKPSYMDEKQKLKFIELYNAGLHDEAFAYYQALSPYLNAKIAKEKEQEAINAANGAHGFYAGQQQAITDPLMSPIRFLAGGAAMFDKESADPNSWVWQGQQRSETIKGEQIRKMGDATEKSGLGRDVGEKIASAGYSLENQLLIFAGAGAMGGVETASRAMTLLPFMFQSGAQDTYKALVDHKDPVEAFIRGGISGLIEGLTETYITLDNVFLSEMGESWWKTIAKGTISEIGEELTSNLANRVVDNIGSMITKDLPEIHQNALAYARELAIKNGTTEEEEYQNGVRKAEQDWTNENINTIIETAMTTLGLFGGRAVGNQFNNNSVGKNIRTNDTGNENLNYLQKIGLSMPKESKSYRSAAAMNEKRGGIEKASNRQIGQLVQNIMAEGGESIQKETQETAKEIIAARLQTMGVEELQAQKEADIVVKAATEGVKALNLSERKTLNESIPAFDVYMAMVTPEKMGDTESENKAKGTAALVGMGVELTTGEQRANMRTVAQIAEGKKPTNLIGYDHTHVDEQEVRTHLAEDVDKEFASNPMNALIANRGAKVVGFKDGKLEFTNEAGETEAADLADVKSVNGNVARLVAYMRKHPGAMSDDVANKTLATIEALGDKAGGEVTNDAVRINFEARTWGKMPANHTLGDDAAKVIWDTARAEALAAEEKRIRNTPELNPGHGVTTYEGAEYGTAQWGAKIKGLTKLQKTEMDTAAQIAKYLGIRVNFINDSSETGQKMHGSYANGAITLNLAAKKSKNILTGEMGSSQIVNMSHELMHFLEQNSREEYQQIMKITLGELRENGVNIEQEALNIMERYNNYYKSINSSERMTLDDAIYEIVADSCDQLLTSQEFANRLKEQSPKLYGNVRSFVQRWVNNIRNALTNIRGQSSYFGRNIKLKTVDEIAKIYLGGYDKIIHGAVTGQEKQTAQQEAQAEQEQSLWQRVQEPKTVVDKVLKEQLQQAWEWDKKAEPNEGADGSNDVRYKLADEGVRNYLSMWARKHMMDNDDAMEKILKKYGISVNDYMNGTMRESGESISKKDAEKLNMLMRDTEKWQNKQVAAMGLDEEDLGAQYIKAWKSFDMKRMEEILMERMYGTEGVIPYKAPNWYDSARHQQIANLIKEKNPEAINIAAVEMASLVPKNAVLIPMPPRSGVVTDDTDTMVLAKRISDLTGRPVINALEGNRRMSVKQAREAGAALTAEDLGFRKVMDIPEGTIPYFVDNVVASGTTAKAAHDAFDGGITLAYAKGTRSGIEGLKKAQNTFWDPKQQYLIPLDERFDMSKKGQEGLKYKISTSYGDVVTMTGEEISVNRDNVASMESIDSVSGIDFPRMDNNPIAGRMTNYFNTIGGVAENDIIGEVELEKGGAEHFGRFVNGKAAVAIPLIKPVIEKGQIVDIDPNHNNTGVPSVTIAAKVNIAGEPYYMGVAVRRINNSSNRYYMHNVLLVNEKNGDLLNLQGRAAAKAVDTATKDPHSIYSVLLDIRKRNGETGIKEELENENKSSYKLSDDDPRVDIRNWMMTVTEDSLETEAEKALLRDYKSLRMAIELDYKRIRDIKDKIAELEKVEDPNKHQKYMLDGYRIRLKNAQATQAEHEAKLEKITSSEGYAGLMYYQQSLMNSFVRGKTQDEVNAAVAGMEETAKNLEKDIGKTAEELKELAGNERIRRIRAQVNSKTLDDAASRIRKKYNSTINKQELMNELAKIRLEIQAGQDATADIEALAEQVLQNRKSSEKNAALEMLRGITLRLGESQIKELAGSDSGIKELRRMMAGSGIKLAKAKEGTGSLDANWSELVSYIPALDGYNGIDTDNALNQPRAVAEFVMNAMQEQRESGANEFAGQMDDVIADIIGDVASIDVNLPADPAARETIQALHEYILEMAGKAGEATGKIAQLQKQVDELIRSGRKAAMWSSNLKADIAQTIDYFNKTAKLAIDNAKKKKQDALIKQLKNEYTQKLVRANTEWREMMDRDREARLQMEDNTATRKRMTTVLTRLGKLLSSPTATKNIPEHMNSLARELLERFVNSDLSEGRRKITLGSKKGLAEMSRKLEAWKQRDGAYKETEIADEIIRDLVNDRLDQVSEAIKEWNGTFRGKNALDTVQMMARTLEKMENALHDIYQVIQREREITLGDRRVAVEDQAEYVRYQTHGKTAKEWTGSVGQKISMLHKAIVSGNMTPEYFFRMLGNKGLSELWEEYHRAENNNGLELRKAQQKIGELAKKYGYDQWDTDKKYHIELEKGGDVDLTLGQIMSLWATWNREQTLGPEMSEHLTKGGFYAEQDVNEGILGKTEAKKKAHRMTEGDYAKLSDMLTDEQKDFVNDVVQFMSNDMSQLGNAASMAAYGIKMYKEKYYYPFKMWDGIKNRKSNDSGNAANMNQAFHPSFAKSRMHGANNALVIGDFMETAADHIVGMINYATMGLANDTMQKVLNYKATEGMNSDDMTKRNIRTILEEAYGKEAMEYLTNLQVQLNGGAVAMTKSLMDKAISLFRRNAVAGSLSVALQQPLSYLRAAMMISPKYLTQALGKEYWKGSYQEMLQHSGVAVIKDMGRFDMGFGQSAREYLMPEGKENGIRKAWEQITDKVTILPEKMDAWTWTRMWVAVKAEQHAEHPEMDMKSDEFLDICGKRFNDIMRRTQVYDSTLVKSQNMRSNNPLTKRFTSFMAEPTLTANMLMDALRMAKNGEKGGKAMLGKASATFILSAILQSAVKGLLGAGRNPDEDKNFEENFMYRFGNSLISEVNPMNLIPGYSDIVELSKQYELQDDAIGALGKIFKSTKTGIDMIMGKKDLEYRNWEDSVAQIVQLFTNLPAKNIMRDARAMYNFFTQPYAKRGTSGAVLKYQALDSAMNADNLLGVLNKYMDDAGYKTTNAAYYQRIYDAKKAGNDRAAEEMTEYLVTGRSTSEKTINDALVKAAKADDSLSVDEKAGIISDGDDYDANWWKIDRDAYKKETGKDPGSNGYYYRLTDAINANSVSEIRSAVDELMKHGISAEKIKGKLSDWRSEYLAADNAGKVKIRNALQIAYKQIGYTAEDADKMISKWK